jgi:hypothetical protein
MTLHDAAMTRWTQWCERALRDGHVTAELLARYGNAAASTAGCGARCRRSAGRWGCRCSARWR